MSVYRDMLNKLEDQTTPVDATSTPWALQPVTSSDRLQVDLSRLVQYLENQHHRNQIASVLFCGSNPGAGVTTIVRSLATLLSRMSLSGEKKPVIVLETSPDGMGGPETDASGLFGVLTGKVKLGSQVKSIEGIDVLQGLSGSSAWMNQISSSALKSLMDELKSGYNWVLLDCPPAQGPESMAWSQSCDGVILILESSKTRRMTAKTHVEQFLAHKANLLGCVLNKRRQHIPNFIYKLLFN